MLIPFLTAVMMIALALERAGRYAVNGVTLTLARTTVRLADPAERWLDRHHLNRGEQAARTDISAAWREMSGGEALPFLAENGAEWQSHNFGVIGAELDDTELADAELIKDKLAEARLTDVKTERELIDTGLTSSELIDTELPETRLANIDLTSDEFSDTELPDTELTDAERIWLAEMSEAHQEILASEGLPLSTENEGQLYYSAQDEQTERPEARQEIADDEMFPPLVEDDAEWQSFYSVHDESVERLAVEEMAVDEMFPFLVDNDAEWEPVMVGNRAK